MNSDVLPFLAMIGAGILPTILSTVFLTVQLKERLGNVTDRFTALSAEMSKRFDQAGAMFEKLQGEVGRLTTAGEVARNSQETLRTTVERHDAHITKLDDELVRTRHGLRDEMQKLFSELRSEMLKNNTDLRSELRTPPRRRAGS